MFCFAQFGSWGFTPYYFHSLVLRRAILQCMHWICRFYILYFLAVAFINYYIYGYEEAQTEKTESSSSGFVASVLQKKAETYHWPTSLDSKRFSEASLKRQSVAEFDLFNHVSVPIKESFPWHCQCSRLNKKTHEHCPQCKRHWTTGQRHETQPAYQWQAETEQPCTAGNRPAQGAREPGAKVSVQR